MSGDREDSIFMVLFRGKSGLHRTGCQITPGRVATHDGKCHRKQTARNGKGEMVG